MNNKKLISDILLNIVATILLTISTQLIAFPITSRIVSIDKYGQILTVIGVMNLIAVSFGNSLNNSRLILNKKIEEKNKFGDFNIIFLIILLLSIISMLIILNLFNLNLLEILLISFATCMLLVRAYYTVEFRLYLDYNKILFISICSLLAYTLGSILSFYTGNWVYIFFVGETLPSIYILSKSRLLREGFKKTTFFNSVCKNYLMIYLGALLITLIVYMDRFLVNFKLGAAQVGILVVAAFLGKSFGVLIGPIANVLLSYYVKENTISIKLFYFRLSIYMIVSLLSYIIIILVGPYILNLLYPNISKESEEYLIIANLGSILFIFGNLLQPTLLVSARIMWNTIIQIIFFITFLIGSIILINIYNLSGIFYSIIICNIIRIILMIFVVHFSIKNKKENF